MIYKIYTFTERRFAKTTFYVSTMVARSNFIKTVYNCRITLALLGCTVCPNNILVQYLGFRICLCVAGGYQEGV